MPSADPFKKLIDAYKKERKAKGKIRDWTDASIMKLRDRFRKLARKKRGDWTIAFYDTMQDLNKESAKRKLSQETK